MSKKPRNIKTQAFVAEVVEGRTIYKSGRFKSTVFVHTVFGYDNCLTLGEAKRLNQWLLKAIQYLEEIKNDNAG